MGTHCGGRRLCVCAENTVQLGQWTCIGHTITPTFIPEHTGTGSHTQTHTLAYTQISRNPNLCARMCMHVCACMVRARPARTSKASRFLSDRDERSWPRRCSTGVAFVADSACDARSDAAMRYDESCPPRRRPNPGGTLTRPCFEVQR